MDGTTFPICSKPIIYHHNETPMGSNPSIIRNILSHLYNDDLRFLSKTCATFYNYALVNSKWNTEALPMLYKKVHYWAVIESVKGNRENLSGKPSIRYIQNVFPQIQEAFWSYEMIPLMYDDLGWLSRFFQECTNITSIVLPICFIRVLFYLPRVTSLSIRKRYDKHEMLPLSDDEWISIGASTPKISELNIFDRVSDHNLLLAVKQWTLRAISCHDEHIMDPLLEAIVENSQYSLQSININEADSNTDLSVWHFVRLKSVSVCLDETNVTFIDTIRAKLVYLEIENIVNDNNVESVHNLIALCAKTLRFLKLGFDDTKIINPKFFNFHLPKVNTLHISGGIYNIIFKGIVGIRRPSVYTFSYENEALSLVAVERIIQTFPNLELLNCGRFTDERGALKRLFTRLPSLQCLELNSISDMNAIIHHVKQRNTHFKLTVTPFKILDCYNIYYNNNSMIRDDESKILTVKQVDVVFQFLVDLCKDLTGGKLHLSDSGYTRTSLINLLDF